MAVKIISDKKWKNVLTGYEIPEKVWKDFDYLTHDQFSDNRFVKYKRQYYDLNEFMRLEPSSAIAFRGWDGYHSDTYFSGIVIKISSDGEKYKIGRYMSTGDY